MSHISDGTYGIQLALGDDYITDMGEGQYLALVEKGKLGNESHKIDITYSKEKDAFTMKFNHSKKFVTFLAQLHMNTKLVTGDKPRYFKIVKHESMEDKFEILAAEDKEYSVGLAMERIFPPWVALVRSPNKQAWSIKKV